MGGTGESRGIIEVQPPMTKVDENSPKQGRWAGSAALPLATAAAHLGVVVDEVTRQAARRLPLRFPAEYLELAGKNDPSDPIRQMAWPAAEELSADPEAIVDPVGENALKQERFIVQKHPDRALLLVTTRCHFYCRFCFRAGQQLDPSLADLEPAIARLAEQSELREVILSGGDPFVLPDEALAAILDRLGMLRQLETVRIHTRAPVHDPARVTPGLVETLRRHSPRPLWIALHTSHPRELRPTFDSAVQRLRAGGFGLLNQTVLLRGVNDHPAILAQLFTGLYARGIKPYYLHHPDRVAGAARFRVTIARGLRLQRELRSLVPGPALPVYVIDLPDGSGKIPVEWLTTVEEGVYHYRHSAGPVSTYHDIRETEG